MEQHPIPQDVTGFQFKLIGDMTIKQFAYLAAGVVLAWIMFSLPLFWLIKWPLIFLFGMLGVALAFIPVEGRPFDVMLTNFIKAIITPNQYVFQKIGHPLFPPMVIPKKAPETSKEKDEAQKKSEDKLQKYLSGIHTTSKNAMDEKEMRFLGTLPLQGAAPGTSPYTVSPSSSTPTLLSSTPAGNTGPKVAEMRTVAAQPMQVAQPIIVAPVPTPTPVVAPDASDQALAQEATILQQELAQAKQEEAVAVQKADPNSTTAHQKVVELEKELGDILSQKDKLQNQLITLKKQLEMQKQQVFTPSQAPVMQATQNVRRIAQGQGKAAGLPITPDVPNLLTGIVKDPRGNTLPNILIEVKDPDGNPVRAFKTNGLGQFAAATQLANGVYTITFEDPGGKNKFDTVEIPVTGMIISPLEVISADERENLRKELFQT